MELSTDLSRLYRAVVLLPIALALASCSLAPSPATPSPSASEAAATASPLPPPPLMPYPGRPWIGPTDIVGASVITLVSLDCFDPNIALLTTGWPVGRRIGNEFDSRQYIRDPNNAHRDSTAVAFESNATLPEDAVFTGYRYLDLELFVSPSTETSQIYLRRGKVVELWPRVNPFIGCV
jgi:hypothetical protein